MTRWLFAKISSRQLRLVHRAVIGYAMIWTTIRSWFWLDQSELSIERRAPVGVLSWFGTVLSPTAVRCLVVVTLVAGAFAFWQKAWTVSAPTLALGFLLLSTHGNGWGQVLHTENLVALHLLVLAVGPEAPRVSRWIDNGSELADGWPVRVLGLTTITTYFVAGIAKVRYGGPDWISGHTLQNLVAHDNLRKDLLGDYSSPIAPSLVKHRWLFGPASFAAVLVELMAPLALIGRRTALVWGVAAWSFHLAVLGVLAVLFLYPLVGVAFLPLLVIYRREPLSGCDQDQVRS